MNRDDIIRMAMDAFLPITYTDALERFAALVAAAEREACAQVCEMVDDNDLYFGSQYAEVIRARKEK